MADNLNDSFEQEGQDLSSSFDSEGQDIVDNPGQMDVRAISKEAANVPKLDPISLGYGALSTGFNYAKDLVSGAHKDKGVTDYLKEGYQSGQDLGSGVEQGGTLGGMDEYQGAVAAGMAKLASPLTGETRSTSELYRAGQQGAQDADKASAKRSPVSHGLGELAGGIASSEILPSGYITKGANGILAKLGIEETPAALKALTKILGTGAEGAVQAGVQGGLGSEGTIGSDKMLNDIGRSAKFGGTVGLGLGTAGVVGGVAAGAASKYLENKAEKLAQSPDRRMRQMAMAYNRTRSGLPMIDPNNTESSTALSGEIRNNNSEFVNRFTNAEDQIGKQLSGSIKDATDKGIKLSVDPALSQSSKELQNLVKRRPDLEFDPQYQKLTDQLFQLESGNLTPSQAYQLKEAVYDFSNKLSDPELGNVAKSFAGGVGKSLEASVPGYKDLNSQFKNIRSAGRETLMTQGRDSEFNNDWISDFNNNKAKTERNAEHLLQGVSAQGSGKQTITAKQSLDNLVNSLTQAEKNKPGTLKQLGYDSIDALKKDVYSKSDLINLNRSIGGIQPVAEHVPTGAGDVLNQVFGFAHPYRIAQGAGKIMNKAEGAPKIPSFSSSPEEAGAFADTLLQSQDISKQRYGKTLKDAVESGDIPKKNATLFVMQQLFNHKQSREGEDENE